MNGRSSHPKHLFDLILSALALFLLSPLLALLALLVRFKLGSPILFRQQRPGLHGRPFTLIKFRTMTDQRDAQSSLLPDAERLTKFGKFLRASSLDELPELWNVLKGEMSLVGPRPEDPRYVALYTSEQRRVLAVRPGITSAASLQYRHEEEMLSGMDWETIYCQEVMPAKIALDLAYLQKRTVWTDFRLVGQTILAMFR